MKELVLPRDLAWRLGTSGRLARLKRELRLRPGVTVIDQPSGSGKSTLLRALLRGEVVPIYTSANRTFVTSRLHVALLRRLGLPASLSDLKPWLDGFADGEGVPFDRPGMLVVRWCGRRPWWAALAMPLLSRMGLLRWSGSKGLLSYGEDGRDSRPGQRPGLLRRLLQWCRQVVNRLRPLRRGRDRVNDRSRDDHEGPARTAKALMRSGGFVTQHPFGAFPGRATIAEGLRWPPPDSKQTGEADKQPEADKLARLAENLALREVEAIREAEASLRAAKVEAIREIKAILRDYPGRISEGQCQRLLIERELLRPSTEVLFLDEPFASLDPRSHRHEVKRIVDWHSTRDSKPIIVLVSHTADLYVLLFTKEDLKPTLVEDPIFIVPESHLEEPS